MYCAKCGTENKDNAVLCSKCGKEISNYHKHILWIGASIALIATLIYTVIFLHEPNIPIYIPLWGFMGATTYILKTVVGKIAKDEFEEKYIPFHVARLAIGPSLAVVVYLIVVTGSVFGITLKMDSGQDIYVYPAIAFLSGYFVRHVVDVFSTILDSILKLKEDIKKI